MRKLSRKKDNREVLIRNLLTSVILYESIKTTKAKAKEVKVQLDKLISRAKRNDLESKRYVSGFLLDKNAYKKMFEVIVPRYKGRNSGFSKTYGLKNRLGDNAEMVLFELVDKLKTHEKVKKEKDNDGK